MGLSVHRWRFDLALFGGSLRRGATTAFAAHSAEHEVFHQVQLALGGRVVVKFGGMMWVGAAKLPV